MGKSLHYSQLRWQWFECLDASWRHVEGRFGSKDRISQHPPKTKCHPSMLNICLIHPDGIVIRLRWNVLHIWTSDEWKPVHQSRGVPGANPTTEKKNVSAATIMVPPQQPRGFWFRTLSAVGEPSAATGTFGTCPPSPCSPPCPCSQAAAGSSIRIFLRA